MRLPWLAALAFACGGPAPLPPQKPPPTPPLPPPPVACIVTGPWEPAQPHELMLRPGGKPFAKFAHAERAKLTLGAAAFVELTWKELSVSGVVASEQLVLHPARPIIIADYIAPGPKAVLRWAGGQTFAIALPDSVKPVAPAR